ncbi:YifB family Mg chelatase-like AAA ATPase [Pseudoalteromonas xiamenensis]|uniref:YifB family Mg chelatase-like AAA ATPase n=1 Tax=Pseudoalteromonas xiamenensis TaxID=882626 RepID=UPI0027E4C45A|nr:YifB family Mg chelatase-like AAA ATPase [Pseudoalteromonas xiamenensis]WMN61316.1 YifB family Mg chelatase-like AAA ATPase [Pseudoalteromonas xiamenensis]
MSLARVLTRAQVGVRAPLVQVEVHLSNGLPAFQIVGLPETSVKEAKERVRSALTNAHFSFPDTRITVNLAPADLPKEGGRFDLAIAIGILVASGQLPDTVTNQAEFFGELALNGELRPVHAILPSVIAASQEKHHCFIPLLNDPMASLASHSERYAVDSLQSLWRFVQGEATAQVNAVYHTEVEQLSMDVDFSEVKGQAAAKRVLEIAAAGGHNVLFLGPPGTGKSMLAQRFPSIMPLMSEAQALESAAVHSLMGHAFEPKRWRIRPFRSPHHTCSAVALVGGSSNPKPGEISLAHNGVLFLDELPEFDRKVLDSLREPMETGVVTISRAARQVDFPARFQLVAALNPSPTGHHTDKRATPDQVLRYLAKISGPFVDRIDLQIELPKLSSIELMSSCQAESSAVIRKRVQAAFDFAQQRQSKTNALLGSKEVERFCHLNSECKAYMSKAMEKLNLSPRSYHRVLKVARTIADLEQLPVIPLQAIKEALSYRAFERLLNQLG